MKKCLLLTLILGALSNIAMAQLENAVSFEKAPLPALEQEPVKEEPNKAEEIKALEKELLAKRTAQTRLWDNPRFVKMYYGRLKGRDEAIKRVQLEELEKKKYPNEAAKKEALKKIESQALVRFDDYEDKQEVLKEKFNKNPRESMLEMTQNVSYLEDEKITPEYTDYVKGELRETFRQNQGMSVEEYADAFEQQMQIEQEQRKSEEEKEQTFPPLKTDKEVKVQKVDDQNALLKVSVGAPVSKRK